MVVVLASESCCACDAMPSPVRSDWTQKKSAQLQVTKEPEEEKDSDSGVDKAKKASADADISELLMLEQEKQKISSWCRRSCRRYKMGERFIHNKCRRR